MFSSRKGIFSNHHEIQWKMELLKNRSLEECQTICFLNSQCGASKQSARGWDTGDVNTGKVTGDNQVKPALLSGEETKTGGMKLQMFSSSRMFHQRDHKND